MKVNRIMVVDDKEENRYFLRTLLQGYGYEVVIATNGANALDMARENLPDLIITDILMPVMDGFTLCREWKKDKRLAKIPLIFYTATYTDDRDRDFALSLGAEQFIVKPEEPEQFIKIIQETLKNVGRPADSRPGAEAKTSNPLRVEEAPREEPVFLKQYNDVLVRKLETKMEQLEHANRALEKELILRHKTEAALRESERKYRELSENINDAIFTADLDGNFTYVSPSIKSFTGYGSKEFLGRYFGEFVLPEDLPGLEGSFRRTLENHIEPWEFRCRAKNSQIIWVRTSSRPVFENGKVTGILGVLSDITEHKKMEDELNKAHRLDSLGTLAGGIAHDFNNILTTVNGDLSIVRRSLKPEDKSLEILGEAEKALGHAGTLTQQLLIFARGGKLVKKVMELPGIINEAMAITAPGPGIKYEYNIEQGLPPAHVDAGQIKQVINNIAINAVQAMPNGGSIFVEAKSIDLPGREKTHVPLSPGRYVEIIIKDTGIGIPEKYLGKIFDPYFTTKKDGNGIGLATCYFIIKNHGGYITVESEEGKGTTFHVYLPVSAGM